ncbi:hypothetical protein ACIBUY_04300 [Streptomyces sp. NPDC050085]|uniref:hypothetical protein n=1 Tax=Streptomyces sp. NPDC050085 TaxID=3365600 RepID=UPI003799CD6E
MSVHQKVLDDIAAEIAQRLPGRWRPAPTPSHPDLDALVWDDTPTAWQAWSVSQTPHRVLDGPDHEQLLLAVHSGHVRPLRVSPLRPLHLGLHRDFIPNLGPVGITVPADPARAVAQISRRLLPRYQDALARVRDFAEHRMGPGLHTVRARDTRIVIAQNAEGACVVRALHPVAALALTRRDFTFDTATREFRAPQQHTWQIRRWPERDLATFGARLRRDGFAVTVRTALPPVAAVQALALPPPTVPAHPVARNR